MTVYNRSAGDDMKKLFSVMCSAAVLSAVMTSCAGNNAVDVSAASVQTSAVAKQSSAVYVSKHSLSDPDADIRTQKIYDYICDSFGTYMLTGQQESTWKTSPDYEMEIIEKNTGKLPAMRGLDFMNGDFKGVVERAEAWDKKGGLVTICWHTGINGKGYNESLNDEPDFEKLLTEGTPEHEAMIANWDKAAAALSELQDAGVTVFWRPFHEFDGGWFWWGKNGGESLFLRRFVFETIPAFR